MVSVANRRVECVHHTVCNSVCVSPTIMSRASADGRATRSLDCGARCPRSLWEPARAACNTFLGLWRALLPHSHSLRERARAAQFVRWTLAHAAPPSAFAPGASASGATYSLDSGARCSMCTGSCSDLFGAFPIARREVAVVPDTTTLLGGFPL